MSMIFGTRQRSHSDEAVLEALNNIDTGYIDPTPAGLQEIVSESAEEMYRFSGSFYISDIIMTESVLMEGAQPEPLMENFVKNAWEKLKKIFTEFWAKIRSWFTKAKEFLKRLFLSGEKFIKEFGDQITKKDATGFKYEAYPYNVKAGDDYVSSKRNIITNFLVTQIKFELSDAQKEVFGSNTDDEGQIGSIRKNARQIDANELKNDLNRKLGKDNFSEILKEARKQFRGGKDEPVEISSLDKEGMMDFIKSNAANIKAVEDAQKQMDSEFKQVLAAIEKAKSAIQSSKDSETDKAKLTTYATAKYKVAHHALGLQQSLTSTVVDAYREIAAKYESVLKSFLKWKPAKEGFGFGEDDDEEGGQLQGESILESAVRWL